MAKRKSAPSATPIQDKRKICLRKMDKAFREYQKVAGVTWLDVAGLLMWQAMSIILKDNISPYKSALEKMSELFEECIIERNKVINAFSDELKACGKRGFASRMTEKPKLQKQSALEKRRK